MTGIITICQGLTQSFRGLVACRFLLGVFEAGFMPGNCLIKGSLYFNHTDAPQDASISLRCTISAMSCSGA
jgi:hypothetical protein